MTLAAALWPADKLLEALEALARASGQEVEESALTSMPRAPDAGDENAFGRWLEFALAPMGLEAEPVHAPLREVPALVRHAGPAVAMVDGSVALLLGGSRRTVTLLTPELRRRRVDPDELAALLAAPFEARLGPQVDALLAIAEVAPRRRKEVRRALLSQNLEVPVRGVWLLQPLPGTSARRQLLGNRLWRDLAGMLGAHALAYLLVASAWRVIGVGALEGRLEPGWLFAWALLLASVVPCEVAVRWLQGRFAIGAGALLKRRLLHGVMRLDPDVIRREGVGRLLGRVIEAEAVESLALSGGLTVLLAVIELAVASWALALGATGALSVGLLAAWLVLAAALALGHYRRLRAWTRQRVQLTDELVERMVGHRTRLAQLPRPRWHDGEDRQVQRYLELSQEMDRYEQRMLAFIPRGWMLLGVLALAPAWMEGTVSAGSLAATLGGILLAQLALAKIAASASQLAAAFVAWEQVAPIYEAALRREQRGVALATTGGAEGAPEHLIEARDVHFAYPGRPPVLQGCALRIADGDRLLLEGASGGGKSTLAALLVGLREPDRGLILLRGLDRATLGAEPWRRRVAAAPQFHDNHVLANTFAFNLLMGRGWPPRAVDMQAAEELCHALGLGPLLARMPAGLLQIVGETGWQLSHGERSRLFLARALLQGAELVVLDESFAALDPESLSQALGSALDRAPTLLVIAHP